MPITSERGRGRQLARRFRVSLSFIENLLKRYRKDGTVEPRSHGGGQVSKLNREQEAVVGTLVEENNDAILIELCDQLEQRIGVRISPCTMGRYVQKLKLTRKKNSAAQQREKLNGYRSWDSCTGMKSIK